MRAGTNILWVLASFFFIADVGYSTWAVIVYQRVEFVGTIGILLAAILASFIAFYLSRSHRAQGGELPEDRVDASIDDGDPELGFFSPHSWWPFALSISAALAFTGFAVGYWIVYIAVAFFLVAIVGWVYEYYRGLYAR